MVLKEDGTLGIISKTSKYGVNAASSSCPLLLFLFLFFFSVNRGQRISQQDYSIKRMGPKYHRRSCGLFIVLTDWNVHPISKAHWHFITIF